MSRGYSRVVFLVLVVHPPRPHYAIVSIDCSDTVVNVYNSHGSSSARFSKYLLPYRSWPINVPALVSPAHCEHYNLGKFNLLPHTNVLQIRAPWLATSAAKVERGEGSTWSWWPYSCEVSISATNDTVAADGTHLESNLTQIAQRPEESRHDGGILQSWPRSCPMNLTASLAK